MLGQMSSRRVIVVGGGQAGLFAAITCAEASLDVEVTVLERRGRFSQSTTPIVSPPRQTLTHCLASTGTQLKASEAAEFHLDQPFGPCRIRPAALPGEVSPRALAVPAAP